MHQAEQGEGFEDVVAQSSHLESPGKICVPRISAFATLSHFLRHKIYFQVTCFKYNNEMKSRENDARSKYKK